MYVANVSLRCHSWRLTGHKATACLLLLACFCASSLHFWIFLYNTIKYPPHWKWNDYFLYYSSAIFLNSSCEHFLAHSSRNNSRTVQIRDVVRKSYEHDQLQKDEVRVLVTTRRQCRKRYLATQYKDERGRWWYRSPVGVPSSVHSHNHGGSCSLICMDVELTDVISDGDIFSTINTAEIVSRAQGGEISCLMMLCYKNSFVIPRLI